MNSPTVRASRQEHRPVDTMILAQWDSLPDFGPTELEDNKLV